MEIDSDVSDIYDDLYDDDLEFCEPQLGLADKNFSVQPRSLLQFDDDLVIDKSLQLSQPNLIQGFKSFLKLEKKSKFDRIKSSKEYPQTYILAQFANFAYKDLTLLQKQGTLPDGWFVVSTAYNKEMGNGYNGAVFFDPENLRVVVAHRGTNPNNIGSVITDLTGIVMNNSVGHLESACTFMEMVANAMREIEKESQGDIQFDFFITGHSLGAYLTQVSAFSNEFLTIKDDRFVRRTDDAKIYHANTYAFDCPGVKPMLIKMKKTLETDEYPIDLENLHLMTFLSAPNRVNTCNKHLGRVYRVFFDTSNLSLIDRQLKYNVITHSMVSICNSFKDGDKYEEVILWPIRDKVADFGNFNNFVKYADHRNSYHFGPRLWNKLKALGIKYRTKNVEYSACPMNTFDKLERHLIEFIQLFKQTPQREEMLHEIFKILNENNVIPDIEKEITNFRIEGSDVVFESAGKKRNFIPLLKNLVKYCPEISMKLQELLSNNEIRGKIFEIETNYFTSSDSLIDYKPQVLNIDQVFSKRFAQIMLRPGNARGLLKVLYKNFENSSYRSAYKQGDILAFNFKRFLIVSNMINLQSFLKDVHEKFLMIIIFDEKKRLDIRTSKMITDFFEVLKQNPNINLIAISGVDNNDSFDKLAMEAISVFKSDNIQINLSLKWNDLEDKSKEKLLLKDIKFQGQNEKLCNILPPSKLINCDNEIMKKILSSDKIKLNCNPLYSSNIGVYHSIHNKKVLDSNTLLENLVHGNDVYYISGIYNEFPDQNMNIFRSILKLQKEQEKLVEQNLGINSKNFGSKKFYINTWEAEDHVKDFNSKCRNICDPRANIHLINIKENKLNLVESFQKGKFVLKSLISEEKDLMFEQLISNQGNLFVLTGNTGEGKSAYLTALAQKMLSTHFVFFLNCYDMKMPNSEFNIQILQSMLRRDDDEMMFNFVFKSSLTQNSRRSTFIFFDAFEKLQDIKKRESILKMIAFIRGSTPFKVVMTTNSDTLQYLNNLQPIFIEIKPLSREQREDIFREEWRSYFSLNWGHKKTSANLDGENAAFQSFVKIILDLLDLRIDECFIGAPKQIHLLANALKEDFEKFVNMDEQDKNLYISESETDGYKEYINKKYDSCVGKNGKIKTLMDKKMVDPNLIPEKVKNTFNEKYKVFSPEILYKEMMKNVNPTEILNIFLNFILIEPKCFHLRHYLNNNVDELVQVNTIQINKEVSKKILFKPIITVCKEGFPHLLSYLIDILKTDYDLKNVELGMDDKKKIALDYAVEKRYSECTKILLRFLIDYGKISRDLNSKVDVIKEKFYQNEEIFTLVEEILND